MSSKSAIGWTEATWNPITGCSRISEGCRHCYAERLAGTRLAAHPHCAGLTRLSGGEPKWTGTVRFNEDVLYLPLKWRKPRLIFVNSMGDLFHESVPDKWLEVVYDVMLRRVRTAR
jgi:protein gp37